MNPPYLLDLFESNNNILNVIAHVRTKDDKVPLPRRGRETAPERPSTQVMHIKAVRKYSKGDIATNRDAQITFRNA